ncbi:hypothetical protein EON65_22620 [archaeon]|nr:MAG: hypothetical protein EON65_22620 [archaeon]
MFGGGGAPENDNSGFGTNNFDQKAEQAEKEFNDAFTVDDIIDLGQSVNKFISRDLPKHTVNAFKAVKSAITPGFIKRQQRKKIHIQLIQNEEE